MPAALTGALPTSMYMNCMATIGGCGGSCQRRSVLDYMALVFLPLPFLPAYLPFMQLAVEEPGAEPPSLHDTIITPSGRRMAAAIGISLDLGGPNAGIGNEPPPAPRGSQGPRLHSSSGRYMDQYLMNISGQWCKQYNVIVLISPGSSVMAAWTLCMRP